MNEENKKQYQGLEQRLTDDGNSVLILDEQCNVISKDNLRSETLKKLKKYQEKPEGIEQL